ncbi:MAG: putative sugar nucleotidyl transferase [Planctomycetota bacterium]|nr:putative sugar nucleotidyl transferase [Planctomycetota bacterium]
MRRVLVFDDAQGELAPLADLRPVFDVRTGALTTLERVRRTWNATIAGLWVPEHLRMLTRLTHADAVNAPASPGAPVLLYNARCVLPPPEALSLRPGEALVEPASGHVVCACVDAAQATDPAHPTRGVTTTRPAPDAALLSRPWHVRRTRDAAIRLDLDLLAQPAPGSPDEPATGDDLFERPRGQGNVAASGPQALRLGGSEVRVGAGARVLPGAILDLENGPVVLDAGAIVRPGAIVIGPAYIGPNSVVLERATIRPFTAIGPWCKVNGEVSGTIFQGYSNKSHDGFIGDSWVGEWVNLGAGTTGSNLLNTYAEITGVSRPGASYERTGEQFLGAIIGDHVKTAIGTRLMTGCVLHTGGMFATTAPVKGATPRFAWATDEGLRRYRVDRFTEVVRAVMARRKAEPSPAYLERLEALLRETSTD